MIKILTKNKVITILVLVLMVFAIATFAFPKSTTSAYAEKLLSDFEIQAQLDETIAEVEKHLADRSTDVISELNAQKTYYENELLNANGEMIAKIQSLINSSQNMIDEYTLYFARKYSPIQPMGSFHITYSPAVAAIIALFWGDDLKLSAELLSHMMSNNIENSSYEPTNTFWLLASNHIQSDIAYSNEVVGTGGFENPGIWGGAIFGTPQERITYDCYSSLGSGFMYQKQYYDSTSVRINIKDKYDYEPGNSGLLETCYQAQQAGVLVPFYTVINDLIVPGTVPFNHSIQNGEAVITGAGHTSNNITIPAMIRHFGYEHLVDNYMPPLNVRIGDSAFSGKSGLANITLAEPWSGNNSTAIDETGITRNILSIGSSAFSNCTQLSQITIPASVTSIGTNAFHNNINVIWQGNIEFKAGALTKFVGNQPKYTVPSFITSIENYAFQNAMCSEITIPDSVLSIGAYAFWGCSNLQTVYIKRTTALGSITTLGAGAFANCPVLSSIYVLGDMCGYKTSANWSNYSQFVKPYDSTVNNHTCDPWTLAGIKHSGTCIFCNVKVTGVHNLVPKLIKGKYYYYCHECGFVGGEYTGPIAQWSIPEVHS